MMRDVTCGEFTWIEGIMQLPYPIAAVPTREIKFI
jgi:hypothetical protein